MRPRAVAAILLGLTIVTASPAASQAPADCLLPAVDDRCEAWTAVYEDGGPANLSTYWLVPNIEVGDERVFVTGQFRRPQDGLDPFVVLAYDQASGSRQWLVRREPEPEGEAYANDAALSPAGDVLYVAGWERWGVSPDRHHVALIVAYDAATGAERWTVQRDEGDGESFEAVATSPDGSVVYAAGHLAPPEKTYDIWVAAFDATTGGLLWADRNDGPAGLADQAVDLAVSGDGTRVFVTGIEDRSPSPNRGDIVTLAYDTTEAPGNLLWAARYDGPRGVLDEPAAIEASPDGERVFVTGTRDRTWALEDDPEDYVTIAYDAATGHRAWLAAFDGPGAGMDVAESLAVAPDGERVYVTGTATTLTGDGPVGGLSVQTAMGTVAYDTSDGAQRWVSYVGSAGDLHAWGQDVAVGPDGTVYATGYGSRLSAFTGIGSETLLHTPVDVVTIALEAGGDQAWAARFNSRVGTAPERGGAIAVRPDGGRVFVAGYLADAVWSPNREDREAALGTVAYDAA